MLRRIALLALAALAACSHEPQRPAPEHVLLIVVDTLRADHLTPYGYGRETSPGIAELAARGVVFENAVSQCSWTSPSMVSLMTGAYIAEERLSIPPDRATLAECFQEAGYQTAAFISNDILSAENHFERGFDVFEQMVPYAANDPIVRWIESAKGKKTFTYVHLNEPHDDAHGSYGPPDQAQWRYRKQKDGALPPGREDFYREFAREQKLSDFEGSIATIAEEIGGYDDDVNYSDTRIRGLLAALRASGQEDVAAILLTADHGEGLWTREAYNTGQRQQKLAAGEKPSLLNLLMNTHGSQVNRELIHVPLILAAPGLPRGRTVSSWVENVDIAPTLLELCDLRAPAGLQGASLVALALDPKAAAKPFVFTHTRYATSVIDQSGMQLVLPTDLGNCQFGLAPQLFDLERDPEARTDVAAQHPELVEQLTRAAGERHRIGIPGEDRPLSPENLRILQGLGYVGNGIVDVKVDRSKISTAELIAVLVDPATVCMARLEVAKELAGRTLDSAQRAAATAHLAKEVSPSVRAALEKALAPH